MLHHNSSQVRLFSLDFYSQGLANLLGILENHFLQGLDQKLSEGDLKKQLLTIATPNPEQIVQSKDDKDFLQFLQEFDLRVADGVGLVWASRWLYWAGALSDKIAQRIAGRDLALELLKFANRRASPTLIIGGKDYHNLNKVRSIAIEIPQIVESKTISTQSLCYKLEFLPSSSDALSNKLNNKFNNDFSNAFNNKFNNDFSTEFNNKINNNSNKFSNKVSNQAKSVASDKNSNTKQDLLSTYWTSGFEDASYPTSREMENLETILKIIKPKIVFVALGAPQQEQWLISNKKILRDHSVLIAMVVGGAFDMILGKLQIAPLSWQKLGLEWLYRLLQEPSRWRRQLRLLRFVKLIFSSNSK